MVTFYTLANMTCQGVYSVAFVYNYDSHGDGLAHPVEPDKAGTPPEMPHSDTGCNLHVWDPDLDNDGEYTLFGSRR
ncbi:hypothetical protein AB9P05_00320 [Roseivirga sp. BDSF3-8]|uniref:hypothetical protein n=1 Tax=Roseivirga sp. BDSF3-8 TaxID=3241598 RepID=UPI003531CCEA